MTLIEKLGITPGPWGVDKRVPGIYDAIGPAEIRGEYCSDYWIDCSDEDARLITKAPEMLETLIELYDDWKHIDYTDPNVFVKPIIEKATGKTWDEIKQIMEAK